MLANLRLERSSHFTKVALFKGLCGDHTINAEGVLLKAAVTPSQRIRDESHKSLRLDQTVRRKSMLILYSTCTTGYNNCCNHFIVLVYKIEFARKHGFIDSSCTQRAYS